MTFDFAAQLACASLAATFIVILVGVFDDPPDWWGKA